MKSFIAITKALADETRVRILMTLTGGELCLCQIIEVMKLAPSTVSKHLSILYNAGLVERRKQGRFHYYRLAPKSSSPLIRDTLKLTRNTLTNDQAIETDRKRLTQVLEIDTDELCHCYKS